MNDSGTTRTEWTMTVTTAVLLGLVFFSAVKVGQLNTELDEMRQTNTGQKRLITLLTAENAANAKRLDDCADDTSSVQTPGTNDAENDWIRFFDADDPLRPPRK